MVSPRLIGLDERRFASKPSGGRDLQWHHAPVGLRFSAPHSLDCQIGEMRMKKLITTMKSVGVSSTLTALSIAFAFVPNAVGAASTCPFDGGGSDAVNDGVVLARYALGISGPPLTASTRYASLDPLQVKANIECQGCSLDLNGDGLSIPWTQRLSRDISPASKGLRSLLAWPSAWEPAARRRPSRAFWRTAVLSAGI